MDDKPLFELLHHPRIWKGCESGVVNAITTGYAQLDACLPGNGWPLASLTEILSAVPGRGELRLLLPVLAHFSRDDDGRRLVWVAPPWVPYAPALQAAGIDLNRILIVHADSESECLWAMEQSLRSGSCAVVLGWVSSGATKAAYKTSSLRRLQLAAAEGDTLGVLFRPAEVRAGYSPAALRLQLHADEQGLLVEIIKSRGGRPGTVRLPLGAAQTRHAVRRLQR